MDHRCRAGQCAGRRGVHVAGEWNFHWGRQLTHPEHLNQCLVCYSRNTGGTWNN